MRFCSLYSGSSGNSIYLEYKQTKILIDCGVSGRKIAASLESIGTQPGDLNAILVTHEHNDHVASAGIMSRKAKAPIYANKNTWITMANMIGKVDEDKQKVFINGERFPIGDILVEPFSVSHDATDTVAYNFYLDDEKVTLMTDTGYINQDIVDRISGTKMILLESNHDVEMLKNGSYPAYLKARILGNRGHLSNQAAGKLLAFLVRQKTERVMLGHLSLENNTPQKAYDTVNQILSDNGICVGKDICMAVCARSQITHMIS